MGQLHLIFTFYCYGHLSNLDKHLKKTIIVKSFVLIFIIEIKVLPLSNAFEVRPNDYP